MGASGHKLVPEDSPAAYSDYSHEQSQVVMDADFDTPPPRGQRWPKRLLPFDPRSPTDNINRTPIIVDKTPDNFLDPRSPTPGVERTPLTLLLGKSADDAGFQEAALFPIPTQLVDVMETSDAEMVTPQKEVFSPDSGCSLIDADDSSPLIHSTEIHAGFGTFADTRPQAKLVSNPKQLFPNTRPLALSKDIPLMRSPLSAVTVDTNSPRQIVQAKQRKQVAKLGGGLRGLTNEQFVDKENVIH